MVAHFSLKTKIEFFSESAGLVEKPGKKSF
jgi:hypothetical protein